MGRRKYINSIRSHPCCNPGSALDKKSLSESDICDKFISPAVQQAGWSLHEQIYREYTLRPGRMVVRGRTAARDPKSVLFADYALFFKANIPIAVIEAKDNRHAIGAGMPQAITYAGLLDVPFSFSSNGDGFIFRDQTLATGTLEQFLTLEEFPSPAELWERYCAWKGWSPEVRKVTEYPYAPCRTPRYYQMSAINGTVQAIAKGQQRILLVMATGTGKTYTAFQIIWRLWKARKVKRVLFLADRNILVDQAIVKDFKPFGAVMTKIKNRKIDPAYEVHLGLYQAITGPYEADKIFKTVSPEFFDMIVIDECHRGSAKDDSAWREILEYFKGAVQFGLTATPKETKYVSSITYFGEPVYT